MVLLLTRPLRPLLSHPPHLYALSRIVQLLPRHAMSTSSKATPSSTGPTIKASAGEDETALVAAVRALTTKEDGGRWTVVEGGKGLRRGFRFKSFGVCWVSVSLFLPLISGFLWRAFGWRRGRRKGGGAGCFHYGLFSMKSSQSFASLAGDSTRPLPLITFRFSCSLIPILSSPLSCSIPPSPPSLRFAFPPPERQRVAPPTPNTTPPTKRPTFQDFMNTIAAECKVRRHHPEWTNTYNRTTITWTTHKPEGLSTKDVEMAEFCDRVGGEVGEIVE